MDLLDKSPAGVEQSDRRLVGVHDARAPHEGPVYDRCIISIQPQNIDAWLNPNPRDLGALYAILDERERPFYEHRLAA